MTDLTLDIPTTPAARAARSARRPATTTERLGTGPAYLALTAGAVTALLAPHLVHAARYMPLEASLLILGISHGAVDHLVPGWVAGRPLPLRSLLTVISAYLAVAAIGMAVWFIAPLLALAVFLLVAVAHWGSADLAWGPARRRPLAVAAARGLLPVALPALAHPAAVGEAMRTFLSPFLAHPPTLALSGGPRWLALGGLAGVCLLGAGRTRRERLELAGLAAFFALVEPVFAVGLYFIAWHSWRHVLRLATLEPGAAAALRDGRPLHAVARVLSASLPCTLAALGGLAGLVAVLSVDPGSAPQLTAVALALIAALTTPHALLVGWLDHSSTAPRGSVPEAPHRPDRLTERRPAPEPRTAGREEEWAILGSNQ